MVTVGGLFDRGPMNWGLRGDPHLWRELRTTLATTPLPDSEPALRTLLAAAFARAVGQPLATAGNEYVERLAHGGMSSGHVCGAHWRDTLIPLLCERWREARNPG